MHHELAAPSPSASIWSARQTPLWGIGFLMGIVLLASVYLWSMPEPQTARPVNMVTLRPPLHASSSGVEVVPVQYENEFDAHPCRTADAGQLCLVIGTGNATPDPMTFT